MLDPFNHIVHFRRLCFKDTVVLVVVVPHKGEYPSPGEVYDGKVRIPSIGDNRQIPGARLRLMMSIPVFCAENRLQFKQYF